MTADKVDEHKAEGTLLAGQPITGHSSEGLVRGSHGPPRVDSFFYHPTPKLWNTSQDRSECLKPQIVPELIWNSAFSSCIQTYDVFNLPIRHRERLTVMNSEKNNGKNIVMKVICVCVLSLSFSPNITLYAIYYIYIYISYIMYQEGTIYSVHTPDKGKTCLLLGTE